MTSTPEDQGGPPDLLGTVAPPREPSPPSSPTPRARKARWSALEGEILRTVILPKLRTVHAATRPTSVSEFLAAWRAAYEPDATLADFEGYLQGLDIAVRRVTVFEGLEPTKGEAAVPTPVPHRGAVRVRRESPPDSPRDDDNGSFDNENPQEFSPMDADPFLPQDAADRFLNSLGPDPEAFNQ